MSHRLPVVACDQSDKACCDGCPRGSSCMNGWRFNLWLKRQFQGLWNKESGKWEVAMMGSDYWEDFTSREGVVCRKFGNLRCKLQMVTKAERRLNVHRGDGRGQ